MKSPDKVGQLGKVNIDNYASWYKNSAVTTRSKSWIKPLMSLFGFGSTAMTTDYLIDKLTPKIRRVFDPAKYANFDFALPKITCNGLPTKLCTKKVVAYLPKPNFSSPLTRALGLISLVSIIGMVISLIWFNESLPNDEVYDAAVAMRHGANPSQCGNAFVKKETNSQYLLADDDKIEEKQNIKQSISQDKKETPAGENKYAGIKRENIYEDLGLCLTRK